MKFTVTQITEKINGSIIGNSDIEITGPEQLEKANETQITFIGSKAYVKKWVDSKASVAIVDEKIEVEAIEGKAIIKVKNADLAMAKVLEMYEPEPPVFDNDIHPTAVVHETAKLGAGCKIGANSYIGKNVVLGNGVLVYPNVTIMDETTVGDGTVFWPNAVIREKTVIGAMCIFHSNCSIGSDGFGFRPAENGQGLVKVPQIGNVVIGNGVEIGSNSSIDRAKFSSTILGDGCKIDNQVQIGHNSVLGRSCIMAGASGLAGSVTLGDGVIIGGGARVKDHITVGSMVTIGANSGVMSNLEDGATVLGFPAANSRETLKLWAQLRKIGKGKLL